MYDIRIRLKNREKCFVCDKQILIKKEHKGERKNMNSIWLKQHTEKVTNLLQKDAKSKQKAAKIVAIIFIALIGVVFVVGAQNPDYDASSSAAILAAMALLPIMCVLVASKKGPKRDMTKGLRENLATLLTTPEQVAEFDDEMTREPLCDFDGGSTQYGHVFFTEHYVGITCSNFNFPDYRFARRGDIWKMQYVTMDDETTAFGRGKLYLLDLISPDGKKVLGISIHGEKRMEQFEEILKQYCPGIEF